MKRGKVLFLYPNSEGYGGVPNGIALLSGSLKEAGFETRCFDTTFLKSPPLDHNQRQKYGGVEKSDASEAWGEWYPELVEKIPEILLDDIERYAPDLIAVSFTEINYTYGITLLEKIKARHGIPVVAGGIFPTLSPDMVLENDVVDMICLGEGEDALVELATAILNGGDYKGIENVWLNQDKRIIKNSIRRLKNMDNLTFQDWTIFDNRHFYKPYCGDFYRTAFVEITRGCHFNCTYCTTANLRTLFKGMGPFVRTRSIDKSLDEMDYLRSAHDIELVFITDDNFLGMPEERFDYFCEQFRQRIFLPLFIQTRCETISEAYIKKLKDVVPTDIPTTVAMGVEHGDETYRRDYMNRKTKNEVIRKAFDIVQQAGLRSTANIMMGLPYEDEETFKKTIVLLRKIKPESISISYFQPFRGTRMHDMAVEAGYISEDHIINDSTRCLEMPQFRPERISHYYENFQRYVDGELALE